MLFFDMDGVLAVYTRDDYLGDPMPFEVLGSHYFKDRPLEKGGIALLKEMSKAIDAHGQIAVLSTLSEGAIRDNALKEKHSRDKRDWLDNLCADMSIPSLPLLFAYMGRLTKPYVAEKFLKRPLGKGDVLVDDFNRNLQDWKSAGGTAIKYINGHNDPASWEGDCVSVDNVAEIADIITSAISGQP